MAKTTDSFANIAYLSVAESAANTLTFAQLQMASTLMTEKAALIIHKAEYNMTSWDTLQVEGDFFDIALTLSDRVDPLWDLSQPEVLFFARWRIRNTVAASAAQENKDPVERDFSQLPGGGLLVPADRLYLGAKGTSLTGINGAQMRLYYTVKPLAQADYWDLIEARRVMTT